MSPLTKHAPPVGGAITACAVCGAGVGHSAKVRPARAWCAPCWGQITLARRWGAVEVVPFDRRRPSTAIPGTEEAA